MDTELINIKELKQISVRITCRHESEVSKIGTGTIISDGINYYVMTAAHCITRYECSSTIYELNEISLHHFLGGNEQEIILKEIREFTPKDKDCALLLIEKPELTFDYVNGIKRLAEGFGNSAQLFGYIERKNNGRLFKLSVADENVWSVDNVTEKGLIAEDVLPGMSGAGLCIKKDGVIYCIGYIKGIEDKFCSFDDVKVYPITNFSQLPSNTLVKSVSMPAVPIERSPKYNERKIKYNILWNDLMVAVLGRKDFHNLLIQIADVKFPYPPKSIHHQREVISCVLGRNKEWSDDERKAFVLAINDCRLLPFLFKGLIQNAGILEPIEEWQYLMQRQVSLTCNVSEEKVPPSDDTDRGLYELIIRTAFCFDFAKMHELLLSWSPSGMWIAKRALLMNLHKCNESDLAHKLLGEYIETGNLSLEDKFVATNIYNVIDNSSKKKYNFIEFWDAGIDSTSEVLNYISDQINQKKDKVRLYGIHYTTLAGGDDYTSLPESFRFLQYIIDTGITTNFRYTYFVEKERWFKVYKQLFRLLPYPCIYYTLQYNDERLVRRAAQEMAYIEEKDFLKNLPEILCKLLDVINSKVTSKVMFPSNYYYFTQELYIAVKEEMWYDKFSDSILKLFCDDILLENVSESDAIFKNVFTAINSLQSTEKKAAVFIKLVSILQKNPRLINALICDALIVDSSMLDIATIRITLDKMITIFKLNDIFSILYKFQNKKLLSAEQMELIDTKFIDEKMSFAGKDCNSIIMLSNLIHSSNSIEALKSSILDKDIWSCGITSVHYTSPNPWHIEKLSDSIKWGEDEWKFIKNNMVQNLILIQEQHIKIRHFNAFNSEYINLLYDMRQFLIAQKEKSDRNVDDVMFLLNEVYFQKLGYENIMDALSTDDYDKVSSAAMFLNQSIHFEGITNYLPLVRIIIARVILKKQMCLFLCLSLVTWWTKIYHVNMVETFGDELIQILHNFYDYDYEALDLVVPKMNKELHSLAEALEKEYGTKATVQYWLNNPIPNRFNL